MARTDRDRGGFTRKLTIWIVAVLLIALAARHPHQAAITLHYTASAIASLASHLAHAAPSH
jgi:hypothetical protein